MSRTTLFELLRSENACRGYSIAELRKIERLYDVKIGDDLQEFMLLAGRSAGHLLGDDFSLMYSPAMSVRDHVLYQEGRRQIIAQDMKRLDIVAEKPFFFAEKMSAYVFFVKTRPGAPEDKDKVYCLDENSDEITQEKSLFVDFILDQIRERKIKPPKRDVVCLGELIEI